MVKAPSSHGLDRKYKSWRRGKSQHSKRRTSLKQQLRGLERLLSKQTDDTRRRDLQDQIAALQQEISTKQQSTLERERARKSHGTRFLERQKLTRLERRQADRDSSSNELVRIALDQVYVGHFPLAQRSYWPLFRKDCHRATVKPYKRAQLRATAIAKSFHDAPKSWITAEQYKRAQEFHEKWTVELEKEYFGSAPVRENEQGHDERFAAPSQTQQAMVAQVEAMEAEDVVDNENETEMNHKDDASVESSDSSSSEDDNADPLQRTSSTTISTPPREEKNDKTPPNDSSSDDDDDTTTSDDDSDREDLPSETKAEHKLQNNDDDDDDFFVQAQDDDDNVFARPSEWVSPMDPVRGDKSKGWATQRQRPGQYNKSFRRNHHR